MQISSKPVEFSCATLYSLSEISSQAKPWKLLLDSLLAFSRKELVVDNLAIYLTDSSSNRLEVIYAKAFGRGKSGEADVSWGEALASQVAQEMKTINDEPEEFKGEDRLNFPFSLAMPLLPFQNCNGAVVYIRFGGPSFTQIEKTYAAFLTHQIEAILQRKLLREFSDKLKKQSDMRELQQNFINTISHELRNPLGFIKGYTTTLLREDTNWDTGTQTDFLRIIERETNHLQELIDNLLDSSRLQSGQMLFDNQLLRIEALIRDEISRAQVNNPNLIVHLDLDSTLQPIQGDPNRLSQVIDNLIINSIKYAPGAEIFITVRQLSQQIMIDFRDTGPGISEKYLDQIFNRFFRNPDQSLKIHGSGLGLSICKEIIEHHSGEITASCPPGWGLTFTIHLPVQAIDVGSTQSEKK
ncbi:MAG: ATP-binding protein [Anaerolineaceae bacterium]